jgi:hypothetical protein
VIVRRRLDLPAEGVDLHPSFTRDKNMSLFTFLGTWIGLASDDSPIVLRERSAAEVYALDVEWP